MSVLAKYTFNTSLLVLFTAWASCIASQFGDAHMPSPVHEPCTRAPFFKIEQPLEPPASAPDRQSVQDQQAEQRPEAPAAERSAAREPSPPGLMLGQKLAPNFDVKKGPIINSSNHRGDFIASHTDVRM